MYYKPFHQLPLHQPCNMPLPFVKWCTQRFAHCLAASQIEACESPSPNAELTNSSNVTRRCPCGEPGWLYNVQSGFTVQSTAGLRLCWASNDVVFFGETRLVVGLLVRFTNQSGATAIDCSHGLTNHLYDRLLCSGQLIFDGGTIT